MTVILALAIVLLTDVVMSRPHGGAVSTELETLIEDSKCCLPESFETFVVKSTTFPLYLSDCLFICLSWN